MRIQRPARYLPRQHQKASWTMEGSKIFARRKNNIWKKICSKDLSAPHDISKKKFCRSLTLLQCGYDSWKCFEKRMRKISHLNHARQGSKSNDVLLHHGNARVTRNSTWTTKVTPVSEDPSRRLIPAKTSRTKFLIIYDCLGAKDSCAPALGPL